MTVTEPSQTGATELESGPLGQLLKVQELDIEIAQLNYRLGHLPEQEACDATQAKLDQAHQLQAKIKAHLDEQAQERSQTEAEIKTIDNRLDESNTRLYSGEIKGLRAIEALQEQITGLKRHKQMSEEVLAEMETEKESVTEKQGLVDAKEQEISQLLAEQTEALQAQQGVLEAQLAELNQKRAEQIVGIPADLLADYEARRDRFGGVGVAQLKGQQCYGCELNIQHAVAEVERMKQAPFGTPLDCSECGRIIVVAAS